MTASAIQSHQPSTGVCCSAAPEDPSWLYDFGPWHEALAPTGAAQRELLQCVDDALWKLLRFLPGNLAYGGDLERAKRVRDLARSFAQRHAGRILDELAGHADLPTDRDLAAAAIELLILTTADGVLSPYRERENQRARRSCIGGVTGPPGFFHPGRLPPYERPKADEGRAADAPSGDPSQPGLPFGGPGEDGTP